jgi:superfamily II DNA or RNA helicase
MTQLRPYQLKTVDDARDVLRTGARRILIQSPTGSGKTVVFSTIIAGLLRNNYRAGIAVHRRELIDQAFRKLLDAGVTRQQIGIVIGKRIQNRDAPILLASAQTLRRRDAFFDSQTTRACWIIDECHRAEFDVLFGRPEFTHSLILGFTATPIRIGKMKQLGDFYEQMIESASIIELVRAGYLAKPEYILPKSQVETSGFEIETLSGDYSQRQAFDSFNKAEIYSGIIDGYIAAGRGKALIFCQGIEHAQLTSDQFKKSGIRSTWIDGSMSKSVREKIVADYVAESGDFALTNCDVLTTGFDDPSIRTVVLNRATTSIPLFLQMIGRGSRVIPGSKMTFNIVDAGTNVKRLGRWEDDRPFSLWHKTNMRKGVAPMKDCPQCKRIIPAPQMVCQYCEYNFPGSAEQVKESGGWERFSFDEMLVLQDAAGRSKVGRASMYDLIKLKENKIISKPYVLFNRAVMCGIDPFELAEMVGYSPESVNRWQTWAASKGIRTEPLSKISQ